MGITFVQKSDLSLPRPNARRALVLAGGAISGGAFKVGGLLALDRYLNNLDVTDFDIFMGISAGAFLAAPLSAGFTAEELYRTLHGDSERLTKFRHTHFYWPNAREFVTHPARMFRDAALYGPRMTLRLMRMLPQHQRELRQRARHFMDHPSLDSAEQVVEPFLREFFGRSFGDRGGYLPSGLFDNFRLEEYIRSNLERNGLPNTFRQHKLQTGKSLYIGATNLNTAQGVVFGHDEDTSVTISQAVQASSAIPGYFKPAFVGQPGREKHYIDAAVRKTANISTAVRHGAQLVVCYNPFRPIVNYAHKRAGQTHRSISDLGLAAVINQSFRTLLHSRLRIGIQKLLMDDQFRGDVILIEPAETDARFFAMNPLAFWRRTEAAEHGYASVKASLLKYHEPLRRILGAYGIEVSRTRLDQGMDELRSDVSPMSPRRRRPGKPKLRLVS